MTENRFHPFIDLLPGWQQNYIREFKRSSGKDVGFSSCGGGWYALVVDGQEPALRQRVRKSQIEKMTEALKADPDLIKTQPPPHSLLSLARRVASESMLMTEGPFSAWVSDGDERIVLVVGSNASGKSLFVQVMASIGRKAPFNWPPVSVSIRERTGSGMSDMASMRRSMMFGDETKQSTGATSVRVTETAFKNIWNAGDQPRLLILDEPDMGLSEDFAHAMGQLIGTRTQEQFPEGKPRSGVVVVTHSRSLVRGLIASGMRPSFVSMEVSQNLDEWLSEPQVRSLDELLALPSAAHQRRRTVMQLLDGARS
jgi:hypothetical protein